MAGLIRQTFHAHPGADLCHRLSQPIRGNAHRAGGADGAAKSSANLSPSRWLINIVLVLLFPAFCLLLGYWVVLARPLDWNAWFLLGIMNVAPVFIARTGYFPGFLTPFTIFWRIFSLAMDVHPP